jgi:nucleotide-binding universal stress UspA family protein
MTLDRILVAVSFSERSIDAVQKAARLAADRHATITLLHVVEPVKRRSVRRLPAQQALHRARVTSARKELARFAGEIAAKDRLAVDFRIETGERVSSIALACKDADVLFIGGTNLSGLAAALHMSTAERLIRKCAIPILVVNRAHEGRYARALVRADGAYPSVAAVNAAERLWPDAALTVFRPNDAVISADEEVQPQVVIVTKRREPLLADFVLGGAIRRLLTNLPCDVLVTPAVPAGPVSTGEGALKPLQPWARRA